MNTPIPNKIRSFSTLTPIHLSSRRSHLKIVKEVYSDRNNRDILKMLKEVSKFQQIKKQTQEMKIVLSEEIPNKYDEDQLKQRDFQFNSQKAKYLVNQLEVKILQDALTADRKQVLNKRNFKGFFKKIPKKKFPSSQFEQPLSANIIRQRNLSQSKKKDHLLQLPTPQKLFKKFTPNQQFFYDKNSPNFRLKRISLRDEELHFAVKHIFKTMGVVNKIKGEYFLKPHIIYEKISNLYGMKIDKDEQGEYIYPLTLPYCEFVSYQDCRNSIDQIFNMSLKSVQKLCFKIYDRNLNGVIDEKDFLSLLTLTETRPQMRQDFNVIVKNFKINTDNLLQRATSDKSIDTSDYEEKQKPIKPSIQRSGSIQKNCLFNFLTTKKQFHKKQKSVNSQRTLTQENFQQAFGDRHPKLFYHLLDYLFGLDCEQIFKRENREILDGSKIRKRNKTSSSQLKQISEFSAIKMKKQKSFTGIKKKVEKSDNNERVSSGKINGMIERARSIQKYIPMKYQ